MEVNKFISTHLYGGGAKELDLELSCDDLSQLELGLLDIGARLRSNKQNVLRAQKSSTKLNQFETYIALIKGYCAILILFIPGAFLQGGYVMSSALMLASAFVTTICVSKLI